MPPRRLSSSLARPFNDLSNYIRPFLPLPDKGISHKHAGSLRQRRASGAVSSSDIHPSSLPLSDSYPSALSESGDVRFGDDEDEPERRTPRHSTESGSAWPFSASTPALSRSGSTSDFPFPSSLSSSRAASPAPSLPLSHALRPRTAPEAEFEKLLSSPPTPVKQPAPTLYETCPTPPSTAGRASRVLFAEHDEFGLDSSPRYASHRPPPFPRAQSMPLNISHPRPLRPTSPRPLSRPPPSPSSFSHAQQATLSRLDRANDHSPEPSLGVPPSTSSQTLFSYDLAHLPAPDTPREKPYRVRPASLFLPSFLLGGGRGTGKFGDTFGPIERKGEQRGPSTRFSLAKAIGRIGRPIRGGSDERRRKKESLDSWVAIVVE